MTTKRFVTAVSMMVCPVGFVIAAQVARKMIEDGHKPDDSGFIIASLMIDLFIVLVLTGAYLMFGQDDKETK